ncbi:MAG TPA: PEGA domain-containing protein [Polyangiaceae bacterium]|jgi:hypothetical protein|nr:PEGA domain-containing protein [Polyangiaceae bacterium]
MTLFRSLRRRPARLGAPLAMALALFAASPRYAVAASATSQEAARHFDQGVKLYEEGDWRGALVEFERAYATLPNYRVLYDIGQSRFQLQEYAGALDALQKYLAEGGSEIPAERREKVTATIEDLNMRVAHLHITANVEGAEVAVDDVAVGTTPLPEPITVSVGRRRISLTPQGRAPVVRFVDVAGQDTVEVPLNVEAAPEPKTLPATPAVALATVPPVPASRRSTVPAWIGFGVGAAGAFVGTYFGIMAVDDKHDLDRQCTNKVCPEGSQSLIDDSNRNALVSTIGVVAGAAGVAFGITWLAYAHSDPGSGERSASSRQALRLYIGPGSAGAAGSF